MFVKCNMIIKILKRLGYVYLFPVYCILNASKNTFKNINYERLGREFKAEKVVIIKMKKRKYF